MTTLAEDCDPYRCPMCNVSLLRGDNPGRRGPYREGFRGTRMACPEHGVVVPNYVAHYQNRIPMGDEYEYEATIAGWADDALTLLQWWRRDCPEPGCALCVATDGYLIQPLGAAMAEAIERHCWDAFDASLHEWSDSGEGNCATCGRYWKRFEGVWFRGRRSHRMVTT